jgi:hypothetical protein
MESLEGVFLSGNRMASGTSSGWQGIRPRRQQASLVRITIQSSLILISLLATLTGYGLLESGANMVEMLLSPFTSADPSAGGALWLGGPFLVLFIGVGAVMFVGVPLAASTLAACLGGWGLRQSNRSISSRSGWVCSGLAAACVTAFVLGVLQRDVIPTDRPQIRPKTPAGLLACLAGANAALTVFVGTLVLRRMTARVSSNPTLKSIPTNVAECAAAPVQPT